MTKMETTKALRKINRTLLKLALLDPEPGAPDIAAECDRARQPVVAAIRKLDPESAVNPVPEEMDVLQHHLASQGAGKLLIDKLRGQQGGSRD